MISVSGRRILVTGGAGFIGSAVVRGLLARGAHVRVLDDQSRGSARRLADLPDVEFREGDIRDAPAVQAAVAGVDAVCHLAYVNGTEFFYQRPDVILEVAVKGMINVLDACVAHGVGELLLASSSEVYQRASVVPTPEAVQLVVPDLTNPRFSYGGGKIISELLAYHYGQSKLSRVLIVRPHNVYGPDMGREHVIPQFADRVVRSGTPADSGSLPFPIQGTGQETRAFIHIDDFTDAFVRVLEQGRHREVYNIGTDEEVTVAEVAHLVAQALGRTIAIEPGPLQPGSTPRRSPDITKLRALGFVPRVPLAEGIRSTVTWYRNAHQD